MFKPRLGENNTVALEKRDDDALMLLVRAGVEGAFDELVRRHQKVALSVAAKYLGDPFRAQDIVQTSFLDLYRHAAAYRPEGKFRGFLARIVINNCRMAKRRALSEANTHRAFQEQPVEEKRPELTLYKREQRRLLDKAIRDLSPKYREAIVLRYSGDLSYKEISQALGIRIGTVKSRIFTAIEKLSRSLEALER